MKYDIKFTTKNGFKARQMGVELNVDKYAEEHLHAIWMKISDIHGKVFLLRIEDLSCIEFHPIENKND
jgi:hypothetical protein